MSEGAGRDLGVDRERTFALLRWLVAGGEVVDELLGAHGLRRRQHAAIVEVFARQRVARRVDVDRERRQRAGRGLDEGVIAPVAVEHRRWRLSGAAVELRQERVDALSDRRTAWRLLRGGLALPVAYGSRRRPASVVLPLLGGIGGIGRGRGRDPLAFRGRLLGPGHGVEGEWRRVVLGAPVRAALLRFAFLCLAAVGFICSGAGGRCGHDPPFRAASGRAPGRGGELEQTPGSIVGLPVARASETGTRDVFPRQALRDFGGRIPSRRVPGGYCEELRQGCVRRRTATRPGRVEVGFEEDYDVVAARPFRSSFRMHGSLAEKEPGRGGAFRRSIFARHGGRCRGEPARLRQVRVRGERSRDLRLAERPALLRGATGSHLQPIVCAEGNLELHARGVRGRPCDAGDPGVRGRFLCRELPPRPYQGRDDDRGGGAEEGHA